MFAKIFLSRLPFNYDDWRKFGIFRHGSMDQAMYVRGVFNSHIFRAGISSAIHGKTIMELGPGDSICSALVASSLGAKSILLDAGDFAVKDVNFYHRIVDDLNAMGLTPPDISRSKNLDDILAACNSTYLTNGLKDFSLIESGSIDLLFSQAVLEHILKNEFSPMMSESCRVLSKSGVASHRIDLRDHLDGGLNNLRFSDQLWESKFFSKSGFYTNRISCNEMLTLFERAGFRVDLIGFERWDELPIKRSNLDSMFLGRKDDELLIKGFDVILHPRI